MAAGRRRWGGDSVGAGATTPCPPVPHAASTCRCHSNATNNNRLIDLRLAESKGSLQAGL